ncbi:MAG TPA: thioredoxin family protein, partial [Nannocystis exedens]|nr:thioredoxin family protein [Nannocystis exedens]
AQSANKRLLVEFTSPGCGACKGMEAEILSQDRIKEAMAAYEVTQLSVEHDPAWALFESLELTATPAFVIIEAGPKAGAHIQGFAEADAFAAFLAGG